MVDVSLSNAIGCVRLFPAVLALAKSFKGFASFARLLGDANAETQQLMGELDIKAVSPWHQHRSLPSSSAHAITSCNFDLGDASNTCDKIQSMLAGADHALLQRGQAGRPACGFLSWGPDGADLAAAGSTWHQAASSPSSAGPLSPICGSQMSWHRLTAGLCCV